MKWIKNKIKRIKEYFKTPKVYEFSIQVHGWGPTIIGEVQLDNVLDINMVNESINSNDLVIKEFSLLMIHNGLKCHITKEVWDMKGLMRYTNQVTYKLIEI